MIAPSREDVRGMVLDGVGVGFSTEGAGVEMCERFLGINELTSMNFTEGEVFGTKALWLRYSDCSYCFSLLLPRSWSALLLSPSMLMLLPLPLLFLLPAPYCHCAMIGADISGAKDLNFPTMEFCKGQLLPNRDYTA